MDSVHDRGVVATGLSTAAPEKAIEARKKCVFQKKNGEVIAMFGSFSDAQNVTGIINQNIIKVCQGKRHTAGGYEWEYA